MGDQFENLGSAVKEAQKLADRDNCKWNVWRDTYSTIWPYRIKDEFGGKQSWWKIVKTVVPSNQQVAVVKDRHTLTLSDEELELVRFIFKDKFDAAREMYPGTEEVKESLFKKVCKALGI